MHIFISYKRQDESFARRLHSLLRDWGYMPWLDVLNIPPGANWDDAIFAGLKAAEIVVGLLTPESLTSPNVLDEWGYALSNQKRLFLLWQRDVPEADIPPRYIRIQRIDCRTDVDAGLTKLHAALESPAKILLTGSVIGVPVNIAEPPPRLALTPQERRNRERMLHKVRDFWVKGVLEKSLYAEARLELGLDYRSDAVDNPWDSVLQHPQYGDYQLPPGAKAVDIFHNLNGEMLILGEPGSGKTTMLLELARDLIDATEKDDTRPIPVVFNLSSWAVERKPLADWLTNELNTKYQVPKKVAQEWVKTDALTLLLDGLDEVAALQRDACVDAINVYRTKHGFVDLVVSSRTKEYDDLTIKLKLQSAIVLQPLTPEQIENFLSRFGDDMDSVRNILREDEALRGMAQSPLMLSIITLAYRGMLLETWEKFDTVEASRRHILVTYVKRMFQRRGRDPRYTPEQTVKWLHWMARKMIGHPTGVFYIEGLQPTWLENKGYRNSYNVFSIVLMALIGVVAGGVVLGIWFGWTGVQIGGLVGAIILGSIWRNTQEIYVAETLTWSWNWYGLLMGLGLGFVVGRGRLGMVSEIGITVENASGLYFGVLFGLVGALAFGIKTVETVETRHSCNQGIWDSASNAIRIGTIFGGIVGLIVGVPFAQAYGAAVGLILGIAAGASVGLLLGLIFGGGKTVIQHFILRLILTRAGYIPWNYARFLDHCTERIFLRKVGGGYIFVHRLLMEYFAGLEETK